jgi:hypothetical protein
MAVPPLPPDRSCGWLSRIVSLLLSVLSKGWKQLDLTTSIRYGTIHAMVSDSGLELPDAVG